MRRLREERERQGLSREKLARAADISTVMIAKMETGERKPGLQTARKLARALDVNVDWLFPEEEMVS